MKLSRYNYYYEKEDSTVVFNTYSNSITILTPKEYADLLNNTDLPPDVVEGFVSQGVLIPPDVDELAMLRFDSSYYAANSEYHFRILTTTGCNARCPYCYERGIQSITMTRETANKVVSFIKKTAPSGSVINIEWFGGEPLVNYEIILRISKDLIKSEYNVKSTMVTNGILLNADKVIELKETCHLEKVQITLDGLPKVYSKIKGVPITSFDTVIQNIKLLAENEITVHIRMNYVNNGCDLADLIYYLKKEIGFHPRVFYYVYPIFEDNQCVPEEIMSGVLSLNDLLLSNGLMKNTDMYKFSYRQIRCFATSYNGYTISPDGRLYNCSHVLNEHGEIGTVEHYSPYNPNRIRFVDQTVSEQCINCTFYPICKGGCRAAELKQAKLNQCIIYKACINAVLDRLLNMEIKKEGG